MVEAVSARPRQRRTQDGIRLVLCEEQFLAREGIMRLLESIDGIELVAWCSDLDALRAAVARTDPDVVVTDVEIAPGATRRRASGSRRSSTRRGRRSAVLVLGEAAARSRGTPSPRRARRAARTC